MSEKRYTRDIPVQKLQSPKRMLGGMGAWTAALHDERCPRFHRRTCACDEIDNPVLSRHLLFPDVTRDVPALIVAEPHPWVFRHHRPLRVRDIHAVSSGGDGGAHKLSRHER